VTEAQRVYIGQHLEEMPAAKLAEKTGLHIAQVRKEVQRLRAERGTKRLAPGQKGAGKAPGLGTPMASSVPPSPPVPDLVPEKRPEVRITTPGAFMDAAMADDLNRLLAGAQPQQADKPKPAGYSDDARTKARKKKDAKGRKRAK
jgi:hypothetical protein